MRESDSGASVPLGMVMGASVVAAAILLATCAFTGNGPFSHPGNETLIAAVAHGPNDPSAKFRLVPGGLSDYRTTPAFPHLSFRRPLLAKAPPDESDRVFVLEQHGVIHAFPNGRNVRQTDVVLDISHKVSRRGNEEGLLGMAFHPDFARNGHIFVHYSTTGPRRGVIARFTLSGDPKTTADPASEIIILEQPQPFSNHNGGGLEFGPDGYLYISFGDGGAANDPYGNGQNLGTWLGKLLRIDIDDPPGNRRYTIPPDNPFVRTDGAKPEIFSYGLRNLWRFTFDRASGLCIGGDVGQNAWEEIDIIEKGANYGWRAYEGNHDFHRRDAVQLPRADCKFPIIEYGRDEGGSVTGGYVYRGSRLPGLQGAYVYADYNSGNIWALRYDGHAVSENRLIATHGSIASFGEDEAGELLLCSFDGKIHTLAPRDAQTPDANGFPTRLSETGLFENLDPLTPVESMEPYEVAVPLWSAGALKTRWIRLPPGQKIAVNAAGDFEFPAGTLLVKHFEMEMKLGDPASRRPLETRVLVVHPEEGVPLRGFTYVWTDDRTDALLLSGNARRTLVMADASGTRIDREYYFPSRADCLGCHTQAGGFVLGFTAAQLNRQETGEDGATINQILRLRKAGVFTGEWATPPADLPALPEWGADPGTDQAKLAAQVRAYLDVNCANCHQPTGPGNAAIDLRRHTPLDRMRMLNERPQQGDMGVSNPRIVAPGNPARSTLLARMKSLGPGGMPPIGHTTPDETAIDRVRRWIANLPPPEEDDF